MNRAEASDLRVLKYILKHRHFPENAPHEEFFWDSDWVDHDREDPDCVVLTEQGIARMEKLEDLAAAS
jgi:hypothetical protein